MFPSRFSNVARKAFVSSTTLQRGLRSTFPGLAAAKFAPFPDYVDPLDETARSAFAKSCYREMDFRVDQNATVYDALNLLVAHKVGALAVSDSSGDVIGVFSERDYLKKVSFLNRESKETMVKEVATMGKANLVSVTLDNPIDNSMRKMLDRNVRHLLVREKESGKIVGMISVKDIVKCALAKQEAIIGRLTEMVVTSESMKHT
jgi:CBS domain-containing protein